jgi:hypothetical protein
MSDDSNYQAKGGKERAKKLTPEQRSEIAKQASAARWDKEKDIPKAAYTGTLTVGDMSFPCSVLSNGDRILTQSDFMKGMGMYYSGWVAQNKSADDFAAGVPHFLQFKSLKPYVNKHLGDLQSVVVKYRTTTGNLAHGIKAEIIPKICDIWLDADENVKLGARQKQIVAKAKIIMRGLAHVGIIALVDEATGYQRDRASDALSKILEAFVAKELQPWIKTFPDGFYEELFRLRGLSFPRDSVSRPPYFGHLTNDIVYRRLAPAVLEELKRTVPKTASGKPKHHLHRKLTQDVGHPKLREHLSSVITIMKLSDGYGDFKRKLDRIHPRYDETLPLALEVMSIDDDEVGL